jgi:uncharacterized protein (DUF952 family)
METSLVFHITNNTDWESARETGFYSAPSLAAEGFIHFSTRDQVLDTAERYYSRTTGLVLFEVDTDLAGEWRWEDAGHGVFPHLYNPLPTSSITRVWSLEPDPLSGQFVWPSTILFDRFSHD